MSCVVNVEVDYANGSPASFASVDVYEVRGVFWWTFDVWVASKTADFSGKTSFPLTKDKTYHIRARAGGKQRDVYRKVTSCPYYIGIWLPL